MKTIRTRSLPDTLLAFRSLQSNIQLIVDHRMHTIARLNGEPIASTHVARIQRRFDFSTIPNLKNSTIKVRDIAKCAADVLIQIPQLRVSKLVLNATDIIDYVKKNAATLGYGTLSEDDLDVVAYLVAQSSMPEYSWTLKWNETGVGTYPKLDDLYKSITSSSYVPHYYSPETETVHPVTERIDADVVRSLKSLFATRGDGGGDTDLKAQKRLRDYLTHTCQYADIFFLDHFLTLMSDTDIWLKFIPNRSADVPGENVERLNGLAAFAGYLHSLLISPYYFEFHFFRVTYETMEKWLTGFPAISGTITKNLETMVQAHDFFSVKELVDTISLKWKSSDNIHNSTITILPSEFIALYDMKKSYDLAVEKGKTINAGGISLTDLSALKDEPDYAHVLMSLSIARVSLRSDATAAVYDKAVYKHFGEHYAHTIASLVLKYLTPQVMTNMKSFGLRTELPLDLVSPIVPDPEISTKFSIGDRPDYIVGTPSRTFDTERRLRRDYLMTVSSASQLCKELTSHMAYDEVIAKQLRAHSSISYQSLYPSTMCESGISYTIENVRSMDTMMMNEIFEYISGGESIEFIRRAFVSSAHRERWATVLSSFALLFEEVSTDGPGVIDIKAVEVTPSTGKKKTGRTKPTYLSLVTGFGTPYGTTYEELLSLNLKEWQNRGKSVTTIRLFDDTVSGEHSYHLLPLEFFPEPSNALAAGIFMFNFPYYYRSATANGTRKIQQIKHLNWGESLLHFALRKINATADYVPVLFDRMFAYLNECLYIQEDVMVSLPRKESDQPSLTDREHKWVGQKYQAFVRYIVPSLYTDSSGTGSSSLGQESSELTEMIKSIEQKNVETVMDSPDVDTAKNNSSLIPDIAQEPGRIGDTVADFKPEGKDKVRKKKDDKKNNPPSDKSGSAVDENVEKDEHDEEQ